MATIAGVIAILVVIMMSSGRHFNHTGVIYWFKCDRIDCEDEYLGQSSRTFGERFKEHLKAPSPIYEHQNKTGPTTSVENFKIIGREGQNTAREIEEAICIRVNKPNLNKNISKFNLPHVWIKVLGSISELK